jgi:hypothetical protein
MRRDLSMAGWSVLMVLVASGPVFAGAASPVDRVQQARIECAAGNYQGGVRLLAELWVVTKNPVLIYNQGRCYEQNNQNELAASRFREYLRVDTSLPPEEVEAIKQRIEELQPTAPSARPPTVPSNAPQSFSKGAPPPVTDASPTANPSLTSTLPAAPEPSSPVYKRWWFLTGVGAVIVGGVVTAVLLGTKSAPRSPNCGVGALCASQ